MKCINRSKFDGHFVLLFDVDINNDTRSRDFPTDIRTSYVMGWYNKAVIFQLKSSNRELYSIR